MSRRRVHVDIRRMSCANCSRTVADADTSLDVVSDVNVYPSLVGITRPRHLLSSAALVFVVITAWVLVQLSLELVWEWRAGRLLAA